MAKTSNINVRLDSKLKEQAELILEQLGIPVSNAVNIFLKQVVMQRGIPFEVKLQSEKPIEIKDLSEESLDIELEKGYIDYLEGNVKPLANAIADIRKDYK
jgi:addiction module antitoxin, RelB/DinJ family